MPSDNEKYDHCRHCGKHLPLEDFVKRSDRPRGYAYHCKECQKIKNQGYKEYRKEYHQKRKNDPAYKIIIKKAKHKYNTSVKGRQRSKESHKKHKEKELIDGRKYAQKNKEKRKKYITEWRKNNPEKYKANYMRTNKRKTETSKEILANRIRGALRKVLTRYKLYKNSKTFDFLGYLPSDLLDHLEPYLNQLCVMCDATIIKLNNAHIDHITPMSTAKTIDDIRRLNQLNNLRLICADCNLSRSRIYEPTQLSRSAGKTSSSS